MCHCSCLQAHTIQHQLHCIAQLNINIFKLLQMLYTFTFLSISISEWVQYTAILSQHQYVRQ